jgi:protoporphyrinogen oxidase
MENDAATKHIKNVVIMGGGPAGLTAAYKLSEKNIQSTVIEKDNIVGGISRTVHFKGYGFDLGGHRFFTKIDEIDRLWNKVIKEDFLLRSRLSRIYFNETFFDYPIRPLNAFKGLGLRNSILIIGSFIKAQAFPKMPEDTFDKWVSNRFGRHLFNLFFKNYTEKVWGISCNKISAEWACQRIKDLSLVSALKNSVFSHEPKDKRKVIKTLIGQFHYPKKGPGMMWEGFARIFQDRGGSLQLESEITRILWKNNQVSAVAVNSKGSEQIISGSHFISSLPIRELIQKFDPPVPEKVMEAAASLNYRDFLTVALVVDKRDLFRDNWIYIHDSGVKVGRIQNFKNWSPFMVPDENKSCLGLEYFCFENDELWSMADKDLITLGAQELEKLGFLTQKDVLDGCVVRMPKAYPVYEGRYQDSLKIIRNFLGNISNIELVGRNGMHRYNNMDHSMLTAMLAVKNIMGEDHDLWAVNAEQDYHEEVTEKGAEATDPVTERAIRQTFSRIDKLALATSFGTVSGLLIFLATIWLILKGGPHVGQHLQLLSQFFVGYTVTVKGAFIGAAYAFFSSFLFGWALAYLRNLFLAIYIYRLKRKLELIRFKDFIEKF